MDKAIEQFTILKKCVMSVIYLNLYMIKIWYSFRKCYKLKLYYASHRAYALPSTETNTFHALLTKEYHKGMKLRLISELAYFHNYILHTSVSSYRFPKPSSFFDVNQLEWSNFESIFILLFCSFISHKRTNSLSRRSLVGHSQIIHSSYWHASPNVKFTD